MTIPNLPGESSGLEDRGVYAALFHALAEPTRLSLLEHLAAGEHRVRDLVDHLHLAQSTVSKHLACLRDCGLVTVRAEGRSSWFALADPPRLAGLLDSAQELLGASGVSLSLRDHHDHDALFTEEG
ncbi:ArsR family transcriptional regulator (plasmid) [Citricoccus sp. SGAir0253]|uniref:ArsR/SmtB family transcription factor n=1 Tax=Citricoccus sp. SGAir0253 TaxID=2567881 RepID=UPI0010CCE3AC|nr:metalloregulator ArsR/SmtB family transcription factor [Citricoccus sp. SGAir0253]QCU79736.1 ArsR family transcriptional regulator [Citricoccus sp. SGAir0253]